MNQPEYFNYYAGKIFEAAGVSKDIGRRVCALHKACMESSYSGFGSKPRSELDSMRLSYVNKINECDRLKAEVEKLKQENSELKTSVDELTADVGHKDEEIHYLRENNDMKNMYAIDGLHGKLQYDYNQYQRVCKLPMSEGRYDVLKSICGRIFGLMTDTFGLEFK